MPKPEHLPGIAADTLLCTARVLANATRNRKPTQARKLLRQMLAQLPTINLPDLPLRADCETLADAYEVGDIEDATAAEKRLIHHLRPLCY